MQRKKNSKIPYEFKVRLILDVKKNNLSISEVWRKYFICGSTVRSILKEVTDAKNFPLISEARLKKRRLEQLHIRKSIDKILWSSWNSITIKKIRSHAMMEWNVDLPWHHVRKYLKQTKRLSFKKRWARRIDLNRNRLYYLRILYPIRLIKQLNEDVLMINIDEVNFSPQVLNWRSWLKTGINCEVFSQKYSGAISMIWAISSNGDYIAAALTKRLKSDAFIEFLKMIDFWINEYHQYSHKRVLILLDNWSIYRRKLSKVYMKTKDYRFIFLPHYTP